VGAAGRWGYWADDEGIAVRRGSMGRALLIGAVAAVVLELANGLCAFLLPPLVVITPICLFVSIIVGLNLRKARRYLDQ
jgi:hypothetical protein